MDRSEIPEYSIRLPDHRLDIFISSTIDELAEERLAARKAIEQLLQHPVYFESGARPHPPRPIYREYLQQSDIFVAIYWKSYGWVAPDMDISGIEDEYNLSQGKARFIYIKQADKRDPQLDALLRRIKEAGDVSYKRFNTADELENLIANDLALAFAERFSSQEPSIVPALSVPPKLPISLTQFVGRKEMLDAVVNLLMRDSTRLLTLKGAGGVGKTRLALEAGRRVEHSFIDGAAFVEVAPVPDSSMLPSFIQAALHIPDMGTESPIERLEAALSSKHLLLILDNFEHLKDGAPKLTILLKNSPHLKIIVTSRSPLLLEGEQEFLVRPMEVPNVDPTSTVADIAQNEAADLFVQRTNSIDSEFKLDESNMAHIAGICKKVDGIPLAIELAAAKLRRFQSTAELLRRLDSGLATLVSERRDIPQRQSSMRETIRWSYELLDTEKSLFRWMSVFSGCTEEAITQVAAAMAGDVGRELSGITNLIDDNLVREEHGPSGYARFTVLELIREFGEEQAVKCGENERLKQAHAICFVDLAETAAAHLSKPDQLFWLARLDEEYANLNAAIEWGLNEGELGIRLVTALAEYWVRRGYLTEGRQLVARAMSVESSGSPATRAKLAHAAGWLARLQGDFDVAKDLYFSALSLWGEVDDKPGKALTIIRLAELGIVFPSDIDQKAMLDDAFHLAEELDDSHLRAIALGVSGSLARRREDLVQAEQIIIECLDLQQKQDDLSGIGLAHNLLGMIAFDRGDFPAAREQFHEFLQASQALQDRQRVAGALLNLGNVEHALGNYEVADGMFTESLKLRDIIGDLWGSAITLLSMGELARDRDLLDVALERLIDALSHGERANSVGVIIETQTSLASVYQLQGVWPLAARWYAKSLVARQEHQKWGTPSALEWVAGWCLGIGQPETAARLLGAASTLRERTSTKPIRDQVERTRSWTRSAEDLLGAEAFAENWSTGASYSRDRAFEEALEILACKDDGNISEVE